MQHVEIDRAMITLRFKSNSGALSEYELAVRKRLDYLTERIPGGMHGFVRAEKETAARYASITVQFKGHMVALQRLIEEIEKVLVMTGGTLAETGWE